MPETPLALQGKDSIRYLQEHEVLPDVYEAIGQFAVGLCALARMESVRWLSLAPVCRQKGGRQPV